MWLERPVELPPVCEVSLGAAFSHASVRTAFAYRAQSSRIRSYRLRDVAVDTNLMMLWSGREPIVETKPMINDGDVEYALTLLHTPDPDPEPGRLHILGCNRVHFNYYHWITQCVPAIDGGLRNRLEPVDLALQTLNSWQEETLVLLGHQAVPRLPLQWAHRYFCARLEFSEFLTAGMSDAVSLAAAATHGRLRQAVPPAADAGDAVYVARTDVALPVTVDEAELIRRLQDEGVRIVVPGALSLRERIALFRATKLVIGPHGAGMANIAFCEPGSFVYELLPAHYPNSCMNRLPQSAWLHYWGDIFRTLGDRGPEHARTWRIDVEVVLAQAERAAGAAGGGGCLVPLHGGAGSFDR